jgi:thiamine biosynthesis protein ThiS
MAQQAVAAEVNGKLVRRAMHETTQLQQGDKIELVSLVGGG